MNDTFVCTRCGEAKPVELLSASGVAPKPACKSCIAFYMARRRKLNPSIVKRATARQKVTRRAYRTLAEEFPTTFDRLLHEELGQ